MNYFYAIVHKDEDSAFGVTFPDLPGCFSAADTMEEVIPNAVEALQLWFEDQPVVAPAPLDAVRDQARQDLADGAFIVAVPYIRATGRMMRVNISMDAGMIDAIDKAAAERSMTRSGFLMQASRNEIESRR